MSPTLLTLEQIAESLQVCELTLRRWIEVGSFPPGLRLGPRTLRWREDTIREWLRRIEESGLAPGFSADSWEPPVGEPTTDFESLVASTENELVASLLDTTK